MTMTYVRMIFDLIIQLAQLALIWWALKTFGHPVLASFNDGERNE